MFHQAVLEENFHRRQKFKNICLIVEIIMCIGPSNSVVEGGFSSHVE